MNDLKSACCILLQEEKKDRDEMYETHDESRDRRPRQMNWSSYVGFRCCEIMIIKKKANVWENQEGQ